MVVLWWLVSLALTGLSAALLVAGIQGKEGVLRIGQSHDAPGPDPSGQASGQPGDEIDQTVPGLPGAEASEGTEGPSPEPRQMNLTNVAIGAAGVVVGLAALVIFAI